MKPWEWKHYRARGHLRRLGPFMGLALLVCLLLLPALWTLLPDPPPAPTVRPIAMKTVSKAQWKDNLRTDPKPEPSPLAQMERPKAPEPDKPKQEEKPKEPEKPEGQIVDLAMPEKEERPDEARYVSQYDTKVKRETKARDTMPAPQTAPRMQPDPAPPVPPMPDYEGEDQPDELVLNEQPPESKAAERVQDSLVLIPQLKLESPLDLQVDGTRGRHQNRQGQDVSIEGRAERLAMMIKRAESEAADGEPSAESMPSRIPKHLLPSLTMAADSSGAPMNDYLPFVEEDDATGLNSRSFKYATFFNRIKKKIAQQWRPADAQRRFDPSFMIHGYQSRYTVLYVVLDERGNLESLDIQRSSGVDFLDQEAISAVAAAAPFPNPPPGVVESDGRIRFPFGFYFQIQRSGFPLVGR